MDSKALPPLSPLAKTVFINGLYEHYKGFRYKVIAVARHSETLEELVLYETLYENDLGKMWVRPKQMFLETVEIEGKIIPRFEFQGEIAK